MERHDFLELHVTARDRATPATPEPLTVGMPFPRGWCNSQRELAVRTSEGSPLPAQFRRLESWSDGSVRWALLDLRLESAHIGPLKVQRESVAAEATHPAVRTQQADAGVAIDTGAARFRLGSAGELVWFDDKGGEARCHFRVVGEDGLPASCLVQPMTPGDDCGPLRAVVAVAAAVSPNLHLDCRYEFFAGSSQVRITSTLRNSAPAVHADGYWDLGDPHSCFLREWTFAIATPAPVAGIQCSVEEGGAPRHTAMPFELYQESSGGEQWASSTHVNRLGVVPMTFRGYRLRAPGTETAGDRATPILQASGASGEPLVAVATPHFWERFPKALAADAEGVALGLLPRQFPDLHELQPGEQITERFVVAFGPSASADALEWVRQPTIVRANPQWYCDAAAMSHLVAAASDADPAYQAFVNRVLDSATGFLARREWIDEYGWRNFGDLYADHETVFHQGPSPLVSHYNNQYDAIAGFAVQFFRTGDERWLTLMRDLTHHVIDIDIYHTHSDKPAYSGGMFWHTNHHIDAGTATHRTYPRSAGGSGGPSAEHNYNTGLMLHYFMTGDADARAAAIELADWVIAMDDGHRTVLRWLSGAKTGLASATGSMTYHGPGRGPGNSIVTLINAWRLTGSRTYLDKADELIRRCVHPQQDLDVLNLLDAERRWYYTVFLQALARYLECKAELGEEDDSYMYGRATLLHYARWMLRHERPYLDEPERLEFPNETWVAQDMRKADVLAVAGKLAGNQEERARFRERATFFFEYVTRTLPAMANASFTRPLVLLLTNGYAHGYLLTHPFELHAGEAIRRFPAPRPFVPQRQAALRRLIAGAGIIAVLMLMAVAWWLAG